MSTLNLNLAFMEAVEATGAYLWESYEARLYQGDEDNASFALEMRVGLFSWESLVVAKSSGDIQTLMRYITNLPLCRSWRLRVVNRVTLIEPGVFSLLECRCFKGGRPADIEAVIRRFGGDDEDVHYYLNVEEKLLGFIPWRDANSATSVAQLIHAGATSPVDVAEASAFAERLVQIAKARREDKLVIEEKYFEKYRDMLNQQDVLQLLEEYKTGDIIFEPIRKQLTETEQEDLYIRIDKSNFLSPQEKIETIIGLMMILDGSFPEATIISRLGKVLGEEFMETIEKKRDELKDDIAVKKLV